MITDLVQIRRLGEHKREENLRFRKWMKSHVFVERQFRKTALEVEERIDCRLCAECCRVTEVKLAERDVAKLSRFLGISEREFVEKHTALDDDGAAILRRVESADGRSACEFLVANDCSVYEARPANCERFPHLLRGAGSLESRMWDFVDRATYCPIVYNWLEAVKALTKFR
ncbi:MAG TPA: YkgJ family cysteine cluster protein [Bryobacteraceae bacterium]|nr:YkgJ family cysteine cluster protein [Bryobacteraceae bacterium]